MTIQDILIELSPYNVNCKIENGWFAIGVKFNSEWQILEPVNPLIEFLEDNGMQYYGASLKEVSFDEVFQCIKETIEHNKDLEKRLILFKEKVKEMQELFKSEDYNTLKTLVFKLKRKNKKEIKEKKSETEEIENEEIVKQPDNKEEIKEMETVVDEGIVYVDTIAEMSGNKVNENNYLNNTD